MARSQRKVEMKEKIEISNPALTKAWLERLPWLKDPFNVYGSTKITLHNISPELLILDSGYRSRYTNGSELLEEEIIFFTESGVKVGQLGSKIVPEQTVTRGCFVLGFRKQKIESHEKLFPETVAEGLKRLNTKDEIRYMVRRLRDTRQADRLLITKIPPNFNVDEGLASLERKKNEEERLARELVSKQLAQI